MARSRERRSSSKPSCDPREHREACSARPANLYRSSTKANVPSMISSSSRGISFMPGSHRSAVCRGRERVRSAEAIVERTGEVRPGLQRPGRIRTRAPGRMRDRLGRLAFLKKKYGGSLEGSACAPRRRSAKSSACGEFRRRHRSRLQGSSTTHARNVPLLAERLSAKRHEVGKKIDKAIVQELAKLGIPHAGSAHASADAGRTASPRRPYRTTPSCAGRQWSRLNARGYDDVEFYISTNLGRGREATHKVASGGEVSRIMLALKSILAKTDRLPVLIFDEIDVGVSGRIAQAVGASLKSLSGFHQVIVITHLPQIAGFADIHFAVMKKNRAAAPRTSLRQADAR